MATTRPEQELPTTQREPTHRHAARVVVRIIVGVVALAVLAGITLRSLPQAPQTYGGVGTENDFLTQVVADPAGGLWAVGERLRKNPVMGGTVIDSTFILRFEHGHWVTTFSRDFADSGEAIGRLAMVSADEGWAVGATLGGGGGGPLILHYLHGSWDSVAVSAPPPARTGLGDIAMVSPSEGWAIGFGFTAGRVFHSSLLHYHAGAWMSVQSPDNLLPQRIAMVSATEGWVVGTGDSIWHYTEGAWAALPLMPGPSGGLYLQALAMATAGEGWAVGTGLQSPDVALLHYTGGMWKLVAAPVAAALHDITMMSPDEGWAVGDGGAILHYSAGAWNAVEGPTTQPLLGVAMVSPSEGWAVGGRGTILHYTAGTWAAVNGA